MNTISDAAFLSIDNRRWSVSPLNDESIFYARSLKMNLSREDTLMHGLSESILMQMTGAIL